jgi:hypothetical protein
MEPGNPRHESYRGANEARADTIFELIKEEVKWLGAVPLVCLEVVVVRSTEQGGLK